MKQFYQKRLEEANAALKRENEAMSELCAKAASTEGDDFNALTEQVTAQQKRIDAALKDVNSWKGALSNAS